MRDQNLTLGLSFQQTEHFTSILQLGREVNQKFIDHMKDYCITNN